METEMPLMSGNDIFTKKNHQNYNHALEYPGASASMALTMDTNDGVITSSEIATVAEFQKFSSKV